MLTAAGRQYMRVLTAAVLYAIVIPVLCCPQTFRRKSAFTGAVNPLTSGTSRSGNSVLGDGQPGPGGFSADTRDIRASERGVRHRPHTFGFLPRLLFDRWPYLIGLKDFVDPCGFILFSDERGVIYEAYPTIISESAEPPTQTVPETVDGDSRSVPD